MAEDAGSNPARGCSESRRNPNNEASIYAYNSQIDFWRLEIGHGGREQRSPCSMVGLLFCRTRSMFLRTCYFFLAKTSDLYYSTRMNETAILIATGLLTDQERELVIGAIKKELDKLGQPLNAVYSDDFDPNYAFPVLYFP